MSGKTEMEKCHAWEREHFTPQQLKLLKKLRNIGPERELSEELFDEICHLDENSFDVIIGEMAGDVLFKFLIMYGKHNPLSLNEYAYFLRFETYNVKTYDALILTSKFRKNYGHSIRLFYILNHKLGISYRDLEKLSDIGKDTLNTYVNRYVEWLKINKKIDTLRARLYKIEIERWQLEKKM